MIQDFARHWNSYFKASIILLRAELMAGGARKLGWPWAHSLVPTFSFLNESGLWDKNFFLFPKDRIQEMWRSIKMLLCSLCIKADPLLSLICPSSLSPSSAVTTSKKSFPDTAACNRLIPVLQLPGCIVLHLDGCVCLSAPLSWELLRARLWCF